MSGSSGGPPIAAAALGFFRQAMRAAGRVLRQTGVGQTAVPRAALLRQQRRNMSSISRWRAIRNVALATGRRMLTGTSNATISAMAGGCAGWASSARNNLRTSMAMRQLTRGSFPGASALRPNLTGGCLPRSAGGYGVVGGGTRYFSHVGSGSAAAPAQIVQNVSQAMRAFVLSGRHIRPDGVDSRGRPRYRTVSALEDQATRKIEEYRNGRPAPGAFVDFRLSPVITAMTPVTATFPFASSTTATVEEDMSTIDTVFARAVKTQQKRTVAKAAPTTLQASGFLDDLAVDFDRALKDLRATQEDIRRLSGLGDLIIEQIPSSFGLSLRVRFPGMDAETVEALCADLGVTRGLVGQDKSFDAWAGAEMALKFPFASESVAEEVEEDDYADHFHAQLNPVSSHHTTPLYTPLESLSSKDDDALLAEMAQQSWDFDPHVNHRAHETATVQDFEGISGIYRFIEECDRAKATVLAN